MLRDIAADRRFGSDRQRLPIADRLKHVFQIVFRRLRPFLAKRHQPVINAPVVNQSGIRNEDRASGVTDTLACFTNE